MVDILKGYDAVGAAQAFGVRNSLISDVLGADITMTAMEFSKKGGNIAMTAPIGSLRGGLNQNITNFSQFQPAPQPNVKDSVRKEANPLFFAVKNAFDLPFERQGVLTQLAGQAGRKLNTHA